MWTKTGAEEPPRVAAAANSDAADSEGHRSGNSGATSLTALVADYCEAAAGRARSAAADEAAVGAEQVGSGRQAGGPPGSMESGSAPASAVLPSSLTRLVRERRTAGKETARSLSRAQNKAKRNKLDRARRWAAGDWIRLCVRV